MTKYAVCVVAFSLLAACAFERPRLIYPESPDHGSETWRELNGIPHR